MSEIRVVLVEPSHPGNIGATARAMKNMGLEHLVLVRPRAFPHPEATARASGAEPLLAGARVAATLGEALAGCGFIVGTTSRERDQYFRVLDVREAAARVRQEALRAPAAILFGAERTGLTNEDLEPCHALLRIPADAAYPSLNLAMAVQLVSYELFRAGEPSPGAALAPRSDPAAPRTQATITPLATPEQMQQLYEHLAQVMDEVGFHDRTQSGTHLMARIRRFLQRAELDQNEANILRGLLTAVQQRRRPAGGTR